MDATKTDFLQNNENIHNTGRYVHPHNILSTKLDKQYLDNLNQQVNDKENIIHRSILDHTLKDIISNFTQNIIRLIDDIMIDVAGKVTFNTIGSYIIQQIYYAQANTGDVTLNFKTVKDGATQEGPTAAIRFQPGNANERRPVYVQSYVYITVGGTYYNFHIQNPLSSAVGSLAPLTIAADFGTVVPSAQLIITKLQ